MVGPDSLRILLVDDEEIIHQAIGEYLQDCGHVVEGALSPQEGLAALRSSDYDLALIDIMMPGMDGLTLLGKARELRPKTPFVIISANGTMDSVITAMRLEALDFLTKPIELLELDDLVAKVIKRRTESSCAPAAPPKRRVTSAHPSRCSGQQEMIGFSRQMEALRAQIERVVEVNCDTVMITGETGSGKEVVAREIHRIATGGRRPFVAVSCPAIPESLVESELFGSIKGAFTGATSDRAGCFELANGGTLFLDEVGDLSLAAQAKLLRALETRTVRRIGGTREVKVNVRILTATNRHLPTMVERQHFRQDLFFRLNVCTISLPPLRERKDDIMPLAQYFLDVLNEERSVQCLGFTDRAREWLLDYPFPGNVRELRNIIERAVIATKAPKIDLADLAGPPSPSVAAPQPTNPEARSSQWPRGRPDARERERIKHALEQAKWNRRRAAEQLGMPYSTLRYKIQKLGIE